MTTCIKILTKPRGKSHEETQRLELHNIELDIRGARDTDIELMNCTREEVISIACYIMHDLVNKQIDTHCKQMIVNCVT